MKGRINIAYDVDGTNWKLTVADNGIAKPDGVFAQPKIGLGMGIIKALAQDLNAKVETLAAHLPAETSGNVTWFVGQGLRPTRGLVFQTHP
jgi:two-component sensor histidine kinase